MRIGSNPQKKNYKIDMLSNHRIVMVVFIPELTGYYVSMLEVLKISLKSIIMTIPSTSKITIVDNGSCKEVQDYLIGLLKTKEIDCLQLLSENIGKIDALIGAARASREPIITLTDCDILFKPHWVTKTIEIFNAFDNVGSVSPIPSRSFNYYTFSTKESILKKKIKLIFEPIVENNEGVKLFFKSINWKSTESVMRPWPIVIRNNVKAIVGSEHQVLTLRRDILFNNTYKEPSFIKVGNGSEERYVDYAIDESSGLRLATYNFYAFHMGNALDEWMKETVNGYEKDNNKVPVLKIKPSLNYVSKNKKIYKVKKHIIKRFFNIKQPE